MQNSSQLVRDNLSEKYSLYGDMLFRICMVYLGNKEDVEEVLQETFIKLIYNPPKFTNTEHEKAWLIRVAINLCKDILRSVWHKRVIKMEDIKSYYDNPIDINIMEEILKLSSKYKAVIQLYYFEDYSVTKISEILKIRESAVKMRLKRGRDILKIQLGGESL
ncbi:MAG TPA: RNA polymerase sigma factor [Clostridiaceae bacterium]